MSYKYRLVADVLRRHREQNRFENTRCTPLAKRALKAYFDFLALGYSDEWCSWAAEWSHFPETLLDEAPESQTALIAVASFFKRQKDCPCAQLMRTELTNSMANMHVQNHLRDARSLKLLHQHFLRRGGPWLQHEIHQAMHTRFCERFYRPLIPGGTPLHYSTQKQGAYSGALARFEQGGNFIPDWLCHNPDFVAYLSQRRAIEMQDLELSIKDLKSIKMPYIRDTLKHSGGPEAMVAFAYKGDQGLLCLATYYRDAQRIGEIVYIGLADELRARGLGRKLLNFAELVLDQDAGAERIVLKLLDDGMPMRYQKHGYQHEGLERISRTQFLAVVGRDV